MVIIPLGPARIKIGYVRILHPIDIAQIGELIAKINIDIQRNPYNNPLYELIEIKRQKLYETYLKLKPFTHRRKRWDTIGTAWKWIAGNPDAEDLRIINTTLNSLITQNNKQILINQAIGSRLEEITSITNQVLKLENERLKNHSIEINQLIILSNLDSLQNQIETLEEAILMAKHGIPSSKLLSIRDFNTIATFLEQHDIHISSFEQLLSQSTAQVTLNKSHIAYILKVPQFSKYTYEYDYIDSIIKSDKRIAINRNHIIRNKTHIYELANACEEQNENFLCDSSDLSQPSSCISRLIQGQHSNCTFGKVYSKGLIKRINDATILINNAIIEVSSNCSDSNKFLNGSFLIQFENCDLHINGEIYSNLETTISSKLYYPTTGLSVHETGIIDIPSPEYLQNLTLEHRDQLEILKLQNNSINWKFNIFGSLGLSTITLIIVGLAIFLYTSRKTTTEVKVNIPYPEDKESIPLPEIKPSASDPTEKKDKETETFINMPTPFRTTSKF